MKVFHSIFEYIFENSLMEGKIFYVAEIEALA
jgi:hypothetical protein